MHAQTSHPVPPYLRRAPLRCAAMVTLTLLLAACAGTSSPDQSPGTVPLEQEMPLYPLTLMGEVHDNAQGHILRAQALASAINAGWRPAIAMEQFDREHQPALDKALASCSNAACVIQAASPGKASWNWDYYWPIIDLALRHDLRLFAANLSRKDAGRIMKEGLPAVFITAELQQLGLDSKPDPALLQAQIQEIANGHCGMLPASLHAPMATAQIARDAVMALTVQQAAANASGQPQPVVLLAGNGHVRRDYGVPRWLDGTRVMTVGYTESAAADRVFDRNIVIKPAQRPDPCASLRK